MAMDEARENSHKPDYCKTCGGFHKSQCLQEDFRWANHTKSQFYNSENGKLWIANGMPKIPFHYTLQEDASGKLIATSTKKVSQEKTPENEIECINICTLYDSAKQLENEMKWQEGRSQKRKRERKGL